MIRQMHDLTAADNGRLTDATKAQSQIARQTSAQKYPGGVDSRCGDLQLENARKRSAERGTAHWDP
jgi:hypothetical protein